MKVQYALDPFRDRYAPSGGGAREPPPQALEGAAQSNLLAGGGDVCGAGTQSAGGCSGCYRRHLHDGGGKLMMNGVRMTEGRLCGAFVGYHHGVAPGGVVWRPQAELVEGVEAPVDDGVVQPPDVVLASHHAQLCADTIWRCLWQMPRKTSGWTPAAKVPGALLYFSNVDSTTYVHTVHEQRVQPEEAHAAQLARHGAEGAMAPHAESVLVLQEKPGGKALLYADAVGSGGGHLHVLARVHEASRSGCGQACLLHGAKETLVVLAAIITKKRHWSPDKHGRQDLQS